MKIIVIGGGAAGFFGAIAAAEANPSARVTIVERGNSFLQKVKVSGGGRCNVTHHCLEVRELVRNYPRGSRELYGPFTRFGPADTVEWFSKRGVTLKTEDDGRMFPTTDQSQTIIDCFWQAAKKSGIELLTGHRVDRLEPTPNGSWRVHTPASVLEADRILVTTGSSEAIWTILEKLGHTIVPPVPSLFTFQIKDPRLDDLLGISVPLANIELPTFKMQAQGPLLITHWGLSGPAVLRLSAWAARELHTANYRFALKINWLGEKTLPDVMQELTELKTSLAKKQIVANPQMGLPSRLWQRWCGAVAIPETMRWADLPKKTLQALAEEMAAASYQANGKTTFKEEFVTAGGVSLKEVDFKTFESKICPGLFLAGEVLDIDAITGGFNFQAAWTGSWLAGQHLSVPR